MTIRESICKYGIIGAIVTRKLRLVINKSFNDTYDVLDEIKNYAFNTRDETTKNAHNIERLKRDVKTLTKQVRCFHPIKDRYVDIRVYGESQEICTRCGMVMEIKGSSDAEKRKSEVAREQELANE